jgi:hypothetical protein
MPNAEASQKPFLTRRRLAWAVLFLQMLAVGGVLFASGKFQPFWVPDSVLYSDYPMDSLEEALRNHRTPLYPLFLRAIGKWSNDFQAVPAALYLLYCLAVAVFFRGVLAVDERPIRSALIAGTLLYSNVLFHLVNEIGSDCLAAAWAILAFGFVLMRLGGQTGLLTLLAIAIATFLTWLTRPAYLFLILLVPLVCPLWPIARCNGLSWAALRWSRWGDTT